jgi:membrane associated rhomboid family serine protease
MKKQNRVPGLSIVAFSFFGIWYIARFALQGLSNGFVQGKLGAIHYAGSIQYVAAIAGCVVGVALFLVLTFMGLRFAGLLGSPSGNAE